MKVEETALDGVLLLTPRRFLDHRGSFLELWQRERYGAIGLPTAWAQDNLSTSRRGAIRGLHFQWPRPQGKLVTVLHGEVLDAIVDVRVGSPTFGQAFTVTLSAEDLRQLWLPRGIAHGFCALREGTVLGYKCDAPYDPATERTLRWNDPALGIRWPVDDPLLADRDAAGRLLAEFGEGELPRYPDRA
ncbi:MAG: dTDP-4-dehydrorhamnose 3,5-epimerase [Gemmatimonadaceae bacterium]